MVASETFLAPVLAPEVRPLLCILPDEAALGTFTPELAFGRKPLTKRSGGSMHITSPCQYPISPRSPQSNILKSDTYTVIRPAEAALQTSSEPRNPTLNASRTILASSSRVDVAARATFVPVPHLVTPESGPLQRRNMVSPLFLTNSLTHTRTFVYMINPVHLRTKAVLTLPVDCVNLKM